MKVILAQAQSAMQDQADRKLYVVLKRCLRPDPWGGDLIFQRTGLRVEGCEVFSSAGHAGVFGSDETGVGGYGFPHTLDGAVRLDLELTSDDLTRAPTQGVCLLTELLAGLAPAVREDDQTVAGDYRGGHNPRHVEEARRCDCDDETPDTDGPDLERGGLGDGALDGERQLLGLALPVIALHHVLGVLVDGLDEPAAVVLETVAQFPDQAPVVIGLASSVDVLDDHAPLLEIPVDHPVYELVDPLVHKVLGVCHDLPLETLAHLLLAEELADVGEADVLLQPGVAPLAHLQDYVLDLGYPRLEVPAHVLFV